MLSADDFYTQLQRKHLTVHGVTTAVYLSPDNKKPISLFVHGINGSHFGLIELARRAKKTRVVLVDLPGHGDSSIPNWADIDNLRKWFAELLQQITEKYGAPATIIAHSFGCYAMSPHTAANIVMLNPIPTPSWTSKLAAQAYKHLLKPTVAVRLYDWTPFSAWRGIQLLHDKSDKNRRLIEAIAAFDSNTSPAKRRYQAHMASITLTTDIFKGVAPLLVIRGRADKLVRERTNEQMAAIFPDARIVAVRGGHMAPVENAAEISATIAL